MQFKEACGRHDIRDAIVAVEMTGTYHRPIQRAFRAAGVETRLVHPFASKRYRLPADGDNKTDDHHLEGIFRAAVNGFGLLEPTWNDTYLQLQLLARLRRDLVQKRAKLQCQIRQYLERCLPGYAALFSSDKLWCRPTPIAIARHAASAEAIRQAGISGVTRWLRKEKIRFQSRTIEKIAASFNSGNNSVSTRATSAAALPTGPCGPCSRWSGVERSISIPPGWIAVM